MPEVLGARAPLSGKSSLIALQSNHATDLAKLARLHSGLLELASIVATRDDQKELLEAITRTVAEALGWQTVALNLYRPAWDDYEVTTVHGSVAAAEALLGQASPWDTWAPLLTDRFERRGAYLVRADQYDWASDEGPSYTPEHEDEDPHPDAWQSGDALFVLLRASDGAISGVLSVDEPVSGRLPNDDELDALVAIAAHAAVALGHARETTDLRRHRAALELFHEIFSSNHGFTPVHQVLDAIMGGIRTALGYRSVNLVHFEGDGRPESVARLLAEPFQREGCYLLTAAEAAELAPEVDLGPASRRSGRGPHAWQDHRLLVPLRATTGELLGVIGVGEPHDRLLPAVETLQALRVIGDRAAAYLESAIRLQELRHLANHDFLTGLGNRRAFMSLLEAENARAARYRSRFTLALCDVDSFKELNDRHGHAAGDAALRRTAQVLESSVRRSDRAFRIGGDEFALIIVEATAEGSQEIIDRIEGTLSRPGEGELPLRVSFGAVSSSNEDDAEGLLRRADEAMYEVKRTRRDP